MKIEIYSKTDCPYCHMAKEWFHENNLSFIEIKLDDNNERQKFYEEIGQGVHTVPQIFLTNNGFKERIGGYTELILNQHKFLSQKISLEKDF